MTEGKSLRVTGTLERFTFRNPDTGFGVGRLLEEGTGRLLTIVGQIAQLAEGQTVTVEGLETEHPKFGRQIQVDTCELVAPKSVVGIEAYLGSGLVKGIGPAKLKLYGSAFLAAVAAAATTE